MRFWLPPLVCAVVIFAISSIPRLSVPTLGPPFLDKAAHFAEYLIFGLLLRKALLASPRLGRRSLLLSAGLVLLTALLDESHQIPIPGRFFELGDLAADWVGGISGVFLAALLLKHPRRANPFRRVPASSN